MDLQVTSFFIVLAILWFFVYWILGGVFFASISLLRLGRVRKLRFSCLFTVLAMIVAICASYFGLKQTQDAISECMINAANKTEMFSAVFGCGFAGILLAFLFGAVVIVLGGFVILSISKSKTKPWIVLDMGAEEEVLESEEKNNSRFFDN